MKKTISVVAIMGLSACMGGGGGGGGSSVSTVSNPVDATLNDDFEAVMQGVSAGSATWDTRVARAAQDHADDMINDGYLSVDIPGTTNANNASGMMDIGDRVTSEGYTWDAIRQLVSEGDKTVNELFTEFNNIPCGGGGQDECLTSPVFTDFGLGKADNGGEPKWALVLVSPG